MVILKHIPVSLPEDECPSKAALRDIAAAFLTKEWPFVEPETITRSYNRFSNANCHVQRPSSITGAAQEEPTKLFIKLHKPSAEVQMFKHLMPTKHAEAVVCHEYAQTGHGARMYGFFQTADGTFGRVDEFLDARQMVSSDVEDSAVRADFAKELATFHTMKVALEFQPVKLFYNALCHGLETVQRSSTLRSIEQKGLVDLGPLLDYDFAPKVMQVADKLASMGAKIGLCIHDVAFMNALVKNTSSNPDQSRVSLIDFEFAFQNYRAFDIGAHFMQKTFTWSSREYHKASWRQYKDDEKRHFCEVYAQQWNKLTGDSDTAEQIFLESQYGYMLSIAWDVFNMLWFLAEQGEKGDLNVGSLKTLSAEFEAQYAKLGFAQTLS